MMLCRKIDECDVCGSVGHQPGYHVFARGATGRVCHVMNVCVECNLAVTGPVAVNIKTLREWAEDVPGGWLDYE